MEQKRNQFPHDQDNRIQKLYYDEMDENRIEVDVPSILQNDGVMINDFKNENKIINSKNGKFLK